MLVGTGAVDLPAAHPILGTNCSILVPASGPEHLGLIAVGVGSMVEWNVPLPETLPAITLHVQDWVLDPANDLLWGTRRLSVPLTR